jgi:hypothetical protein
MMMMMERVGRDGFGHDAVEIRVHRLRALRAMLAFAAQEAQALGEAPLSGAIEHALETAELAVSTDLGRPYTHDA